jgi:L-fucose mutarotase
MLKAKLLHPHILETLAAAGHGARVLIADGNFPASTVAPQSARKVYLNLSPGIVKVTEALAACAALIPIESAVLMAPPDNSAQPIHNEIRALLPAAAVVELKKRLEFYEIVRSPETALVIATGEQRRFANCLFTIGVVKEGE